MKRDKKVRPDRTSGVKAESDDYEIEKGSIRLFVAGHQAFANSNRRPHWLAKVVKKLLSHSDILNAAAKGKASFDVVREAEESQTIGRLAAMSADEFADGLIAGTLGGSGESLDPLTRTVLGLSLEHIPAGFGNVSSVVEHVKHALRRHVGAQFKNGKSEDEVTATLMRKVNYESHEAITF